MSRARRIVAVMALVACVALAAAAVLSFIRDGREREAYGRVASAATREGDGSVKDMAKVRELCPGAVAWLEVEGTPISYPVMEATEEAPEFYLDHDAWGNRSADGVPFLDSRCSVTGSHLLVYGHHVIFTDRMFSPLQKAYEQDVFEGIGDAVWTTQDGSERFEPIMSMGVDRSFSPIQSFSFSDISALRGWIASLSVDATAKSPASADLASSAKKVLTLVTCSSDFSGRRQRTLTLFVER